MFLLGRAALGRGAARPRRLTEGSWAAARAVGHALAGHALLALGRTARRAQALAAAEKELATSRGRGRARRSRRRAVEPWVDTLRGELLLRDGSAGRGAHAPAGGRAHAARAARTGRLDPGACSAWRRSPAWRARSGDWELAEYTARQMLEHDAAYAGSHLAQALVAAHQGDAAAAARAGRGPSALLARRRRRPARASDRARCRHPNRGMTPAVFFGHGNPMNALQRNTFTEGWAASAGRSRGRRAVLAVSAHWYVPGTRRDGDGAPRTIHDFGGFPPRALPGALSGARRPGRWPHGCRRSSRRCRCGSTTRWGLDHGTWSVLVPRLPGGRRAGRAAQHRRDQAPGVPLRARASGWRRCATKAC